MLKFPQNYSSKNLYSSTGGISGAVTGSSPASFAAAAISSQLLGECMGARVSATAFTNGLALNVKWQVLDNDNATWIDVVDSYNPANVALVTGAGTSGGTTATKIFTAPEALRAGNRSARCLVYGSGSAPALGSGFDQATVSYDFRGPINGYGP